MSKLQTGRRAIAAVAAVLIAAPWRGTRAQARDDQGRRTDRRPGTDAPTSSLIWARNERTGEEKYFVSNAPEGTPLGVLLRVLV